jgi:hypothetical protein
VEDWKVNHAALLATRCLEEEDEIFGSDLDGLD